MPPLNGELLTKLTVWLALGGYALGAALLRLARARRRWLAWARVMWTIGCAFFLAHVACAFAFFHGWSHAAAYRETARQTAGMTGVNWGGGLFLNYLFALAWLADVLWWWLAPENFARRPRALTVAWQGFFFFMVFNGTIVFGKGPVRWFGAAIGVGLALLWVKTRHPRIVVNE